MQVGLMNNPKDLYKSIEDFIHTPHEKRMSYEEWATLSCGHITVKQWDKAFKTKKHVEQVYKQLLEDRETEPVKLNPDRLSIKKQLQFTIQRSIYELQGFFPIGA